MNLAIEVRIIMIHIANKKIPPSPDHIAPVLQEASVWRMLLRHANGLRVSERGGSGTTIKTQL